MIEFGCVHSNVNVSVKQTLPVSGDDVTVSYFVKHDVHQFIPITVDIYHKEKFFVAFRCENGSIGDGRAAFVKVIFKGWCEDPTVIVRNIAVSISLELDVTLDRVIHTCSTVTTGPQSEYVFSHTSTNESLTLPLCHCLLIYYMCVYYIYVGLELFMDVDSESGQLAPFVQLLNVDTCNRAGPAVPIRLTTSTNSTIVLFPDGTNEKLGDISMRPLNCSDNHTQVYAVFVSSPEDYTLYGEMVNSLLPVSCIIVPVPSELSAYSTARVACKHLTCLIASHHF